MQTPSLARLRKIYPIPMSKLQEYWDKAKLIASKSNSGNKDVASLIFHNMLSMSEDIPDWWKRLTKEEKDEYLAKYPGSKYADDADEIADNSPAWWKKLTPAEQQKHLDDNPDDSEGLQVLPDDPVSIKGAMKKAWGKRRAKAATTLSHHKAGLHSLKTLLTGGALNRNDRSQAKKTAILATKLVLGALVGIALFTALAPMAAIVAKIYLGDNVPGADSMSADQNSGTDNAESVLDGIHEWLLKQNIKELTEKAKALSDASAV